MDRKSEHPTSLEEVHDNHFNGATPPKKGGRVKRHCKRFWWLDLIVLAIGLLVALLLIFLVIIPKKAQHDINASTLEITLQQLTEPTPEGCHLKVVSVARSSSKFHPTLEGFRAGLSLEGNDPFLYLDVPETKAQAATDIVIEQDVKFASMENFIEYNKAVMGSESLVVHMDGKTKIHLGALRPMSVNYNKKVTLKGLNKLQGLNITDFKILSGAREILDDGSNVVGTVYIPNPSVILLSLGNVTLDMSVDDKVIGKTLLPNLVLKPGDNYVPMQGTIAQLDIITLITSKYKNGILPLSIFGNSSVANGQHLEYFEAAIRSNTIHLDLDSGPALRALNINITGSA